MLYKCKQNCFDSNKARYYKEGQIYPSVPDVLKKYFVPLSVEEDVNDKAMKEELKMLVIKLGLDKEGLNEIMKTYHIKQGKGVEQELIPILRDLLKKQEKEKGKKK